MLYIPKNRQISLKIPRISAQYTIADTLLLTNTIDLTLLTIAVEVLEMSARYFTVSATFPDLSLLQGGEYRYKLMNGRVIVSSGLAIVENRGDFNNDFNIDFLSENNFAQNEYQEQYYQYKK